MAASGPTKPPPTMWIVCCVISFFPATHLTQRRKVAKNCRPGSNFAPLRLCVRLNLRQPSKYRSKLVHIRKPIVQWRRRDANAVGLAPVADHAVLRQALEHLPAVCFHDDR